MTKTCSTCGIVADWFYEGLCPRCEVTRVKDNWLAAEDEIDRLMGLIGAMSTRVLTAEEGTYLKEVIDELRTEAG